MKHLLLIALVAVALTAQAQDSKYTAAKRTGGGDFGISTATVSGDIQIEGKSFDIYTTNSGSRFIKLKSPKTGGVYAVWLGEQTGDVHDGQPVMITKSGKPFILKVSASTGNPYPVWLQIR